MDPQSLRDVMADVKDGVIAEALALREKQIEQIEAEDGQKLERLVKEQRVGQWWKYRPPVRPGSLWDDSPENTARRRAAMMGEEA